MISKNHKKIYQHLHRTTAFGKRAKMPRHLDWFIQLVQPRSICDFGCGKGHLINTIKTKYNGINVFGYDPGNPEFAAGIESLDADLIVSCDVLEHVEPNYINETLNYLCQRSRYIYHVIALSPAKLTLPDGRNAHLIQESCGWWRDKFLNLGYHLIKEDYSTATKISKQTQTPLLSEHYFIMAERTTQ